MRAALRGHDHNVEAVAFAPMSAYPAICQLQDVTVRASFHNTMISSFSVFVGCAHNARRFCCHSIARQDDQTLGCIYSGCSRNSDNCAYFFFLLDFLLIVTRFEDPLTAVSPSFTSCKCGRAHGTDANEKGAQKNPGAAGMDVSAFEPTTGSMLAIAGQ